MHLVHGNAQRPDAIDAHALHDIHRHHDHGRPQRRAVARNRGFPHRRPPARARLRRARRCARSCRPGSARRPRHTTSRWCRAPATRCGTGRGSTVIASPASSRTVRVCVRARGRGAPNEPGAASASAVRKACFTAAVVRPCADVRGAAGATGARGARDARLQRTLAPVARGVGGARPSRRAPAARANAGARA